MNTMNEQLKNLYESKWNDLCNELKTIIDGEHTVKPGYPFLLTLNRWDGKDTDKSGKWYENADIRVMIFGQEANFNGWKCGEDDDPDFPKTSAFNPKLSMDCITATYEGMNQWQLNSNNDYKNVKSLFAGYVKFMTLLRQQYPEKNIACLWNNLVKIGMSNKKGCAPTIYNIEKEYFNVVPQEVKILEPNIIIFMTGGYDEKIKNNFGEVTFLPIASFAANEVAKVELPNVNALAYRTYHPSARNISNEKREEYYKAIIEVIKKSFKI
jgi:hypothetical protein